MKLPRRYKRVSQNNTARSVLEYIIERTSSLDHQDNTSSVIGEHTTKLQPTTLWSTNEIGSTVGTSLPNTSTLKNPPTSHFESEDRLRECLSSLKTLRTAHVGILGCGWEQYCMESTLIGVCVAIDTNDTTSMQDVNPEGEPEKRLLLDRTLRLQQVFSFMNQRAFGQTECRPSHEDDGSCKANQRFKSDVFSSMGGFCLDDDFSSLSDHHTRSGFRNLESGYPYTIFYDIVEYGCNNNIDLMTCECTSNAYGGTVLSCQYDKLCESRETPCFGDDTILQYCSRLTIEAHATSVNNFDFKLCHLYLSPVEMIYCYQVVTQNGLIACSMTMNDEECQSCDLDPQNVCSDFDCSNTPLGRVGNLCSDQPLGDLVLLELLDCSGACNIAVKGTNCYIVAMILAQLQPLCSTAIHITPLYSEALMCEDLQKVAPAAWQMDSDGFCRIAPDVDISPQCCLMTSTDSPLPPPAELPRIICEDLHHDCFGCIETELVLVPLVCIVLNNAVPFR